MIKYVVQLYEKWNISEIEVEKESRKCIWLNGKQKRKKGKYTAYFNTYEDAHSFIYNNLLEGFKWIEGHYTEEKSNIENFLKKYPKP